jgi:hypothetical protein
MRAAAGRGKSPDGHDLPHATLMEVAVTNLQIAYRRTARALLTHGGMNHDCSRMG